LGAVIATIVAAWNIYKDFLKRYRVKVSAIERIHADENYRRAQHLKNVKL
jgi:hypothetical protein